ncbi:restriction endonuclease subunit S [Mycoplasmopsis felis]|uniref:restriction endonuclease subunit S n=1 Tax=Mycoplasmopsis felis TaxID=33923 RepID=UPI003A4E0F8B
MKKVLVPKVRFKGFEGEWKEETIGNIANITNGKSNTSDNNKWGQYNLYIRSEEIYKSNKYIFDVEGVITVGDGNIGKIFHYVNGKFDLHQRCYLIYEFQNIWPKYFYYYFSQNFYKRAILMSYTATVNSIRMNTITDMDIMFPKELIEQQKIGKLLDQISNLITLEQSKLNKLKKLKKTLLEKMFPEHNSKKPRIRFKGFEGEWKEYKFNDIGSYYSTSSLSYNDLSKGGRYKCVLYGELYTKYNERIFNVISRTNKKITLTQPNDILFPTSTTVDSYSLISPSCVNEENVMTGGDLFGIRPYKNINGNFISYYINNVEYIKNKLANKAQGLTIIHLYYKNILNENLYIASLEEQNKIAKLFVKIDTIINLYQSKLKKLKKIKEALLQKMFL